MSVRDAIQTVLDLDRQLQETKASTISDLLDQRGEIDDALKALGHDGTARPAKTKKTEPKPDAQKYCKTCQQYGHDGRFHRRKDQQH